MPKDKVQGRELVTLRYGVVPGGRTFEIVGTKVMGVRLDGLASALRIHNAAHPQAEYEVLAEVKCTTEESDTIIKTIRGTGVSLKHYWAPASSAANPQPGPYGIGYFDILH
jgi:hypothetical protein